MLKPMYLVQGTGMMRNTVYAVPAEMGIVKQTGCYWFVPAIKDEDGCYPYAPSAIAGVENYSLPHQAQEIKDKYSDIPGIGEAWLVEEGRKYINWTQVDQDLHLLDEKGNIVKE